MDGEPRTATSTLTQLLNYDTIQLKPWTYIYRSMAVTYGCAATHRDGKVDVFNRAT